MSSWEKNNFLTITPKISGSTIKKENFAELSLSNPSRTDVEIVAPDLDNPGMRAIAWEIPITIEPKILTLFVVSLDLSAKNNKIAVILCLPGGSSNKLINTLWSNAKDLNPTIALTKLDECEMGPEEFSNLAENNAKISIITGTDGIVGTVAIASENVMTQYLKENC